MIEPPTTLRGWSKRSRAEYVAAYWAWIDEGSPQRWAFWRVRDELDGLILGVVLALLILIPVLVIVL